MLTEADKKNRIGAITGTCIAGIVGIHPYVTPYRAYLMVMGEWDPKPSEAMLWGSRLEGQVAEHYSSIHGVDLVSPGFMRHKRRSWMGGTPDRIHADGSKVVEIKTVGLRQAGRWEDGPPPEHVAQVAWYQALLNIDEAGIAALFGGQQYREHELLRDAELEEALIDAGKKFFKDHIEPQKPPAADHFSETTQFLRQKFSDYREGDYLLSTPETDKLVHDLELANEAAAQVKARRDRLRNQLMQHIGTHTGIEGPWGRVVWGSRRGRIDWRRVVEDKLSLSGEELEEYRRPPERVFQTHVDEQYNWEKHRKFRRGGGKKKGASK